MTKKSKQPELINIPNYEDTELDTSLEVYDEIDLANIAEQRFIAGAINNILRQLPDANKKSLKNCAECDSTIPLARRKALPGVTLCVDCQQEAEDTNRRKQLLQGYVYRSE